MISPIEGPPHVPAHESYSHDDPYNNVENYSPLTVTVLGLQGEDLGMGVLVGGAYDVDGYFKPVIVLDDPNAPGGLVALKGDQCEWSCLIEDGDAIIDDAIEEDSLPFSAWSYYLSLLEKGEKNDRFSCLTHSVLF